MTDLHIKWATLFGVYPSRVMTENCAPVSIQVSVDAVTSRGPLGTLGWVENAPNERYQKSTSEYM